MPTGLDEVVEKFANMITNAVGFDVEVRFPHVQLTKSTAIAVDAISGLLLIILRR